MDRPTAIVRFRGPVLGSASQKSGPPLPRTTSVTHVPHLDPR